jgi:hypothetical protein
VMLGGRVVQAGAIHDVLGRPRCPFVAKFLGLDPATAAESPACATQCLATPGRCTAADAPPATPKESASER